MTMSQTSFLTEIIGGNGTISKGKLAYFRERQRNRLYDFIVSRFLEKERSEKFSKADLARRLNKEPAQITRWLSTPGNWTLDTISDLMLAVCGGELEFKVAPFVNIKQRNSNSLEILRVQNTPASPTTKPTMILKILKHANT